MKSLILALALASQVHGHATFQQLWVDSVDMISPPSLHADESNSPVTNVAGADIRCNVGGARGVGGKCPVKAGGVVTVEMHAQPGDRSCKSEAIGGSHYGPVIVYLSKVPDSSTADGSAPWFKIFESGWSAKAGAGSGDDDNWGVKDLNACCGKVDVPLPKDLENGDYLLRAEVVALHTAGSSGGAQFYMTCFQVTVSGGGGKVFGGVTLPGAYKSSDPGILVNIHGKLNGYVIPGPAVVAGGVTKTPGAGGCTGCAATCEVGKGPVGTAVPVPGGGNGGGGGGGGGGGCSVAKYQQCGGTGFTGCTTCAAGSTCQAISPPHYYQCA
ncbi:endo-beta-1,4-glucanase D 5 [Colletotrichum plurivorum]|uniref:lytic cellulose monooxygenase (C4-dehydrogenating) n=1 Tax=Colletotrichum plurivorum TaxID=2175906 RepID=A0A8H6NJX2_9PEZI|nr:endo-beta-1,4-glucanase D 5 [Colletotrichum plurivorum]